MKRKLTVGMALRTLRKRLRYRSPSPELVECTICANDLSNDAFPTEPLSDDCKNHQAACLECIQEHHRVLILDRSTNITCYGCVATVDFERVKKYTDGSSFEKYETRSPVPLRQHMLTALDGMNC